MPRTAEQDMRAAEGYLKKHPGAGGYGDSDNYANAPDPDYQYGDSPRLYKKGMRINPSAELPSGDDDDDAPAYQQPQQMNHFARPKQ